MFKSRKREEGSEAATGRHRPPPPMTPIEIGFALRTAREKSKLSLADVRDRTDVPLVDLDALENGRLDIFHVEQAAVVALWRYAEAMGLEPDPLVEVIHRSWPNPALGIDAFRSMSPLVATPIAQLAIASSMLSPISRPSALVSSSANIGLSQSTLSVLSAASLGTARAISAIGPASAAPPSVQASATQVSAPEIEAPVEEAPQTTIATALKAVESNAAAVAKRFAPRAAAILNAARSTPEASPAKTAAKADTAIEPEILEPEIAETVDEVVVEAPEPLRVVHMDDTQAVAKIEVEAPQAVLAADAETVATVEVQSAEQALPKAVARPTTGNWAARLSKVFAERFGVEVTKKD